MRDFPEPDLNRDHLPAMPERNVPPDPRDRGPEVDALDFEEQPLGAPEGRHEPRERTREDDDD